MTIIGKKVVNFVSRNIVCRFGIPHRIIFDSEKQFTINPFKSWCKKLENEHLFTSVAHTQADGQVEVTNRTIIQGLKTRLEQAKGD